MSETDNLILEPLRALRSDIGDMRSDVQDLKHRVSSMEHKIAAMHGDLAMIHADIANINMRLDRQGTDITLIKRRLDIVEEPV